jgi:nicotinate-nucleotide--dimethylbenzimidazole phosphoribosyltransferase
MQDIRARLNRLPAADAAAVAQVRQREAMLTKPAGALGRLEVLTEFLAAWQGRYPPRLATVRIAVFAGNHGVAERGVSAFPASVTAEMVENFTRGGAAINQLAKVAGATLAVVPLSLDRPTNDLAGSAAMTEADFRAAFEAGAAVVESGLDLLAVGEMGIGNTTAAAALAAALFGGNAFAWVGRGTGIDDKALLRKAGAIDQALAHHGAALAAPFEALRRVGGRELAAITGAVLAAREKRVPVVLDGFVATAAAAVLHKAVAGALDHCIAGHRSAESGHDKLLTALGMKPLLDLSLRLGEGSGAALAISLLRAAVACHTGMATFGDAGVSNKLG